MQAWLADSSRPAEGALDRLGVRPPDAGHRLRVGVGKMSRRSTRAPANHGRSIAGRGGPRLARDRRGPIHRARRRAAAHLPDPLAHGPGRAPPQGHDRSGRGDRPRRRLPGGVRVQPRVQPPPRSASRAVPARRVAAAGGQFTDARAVRPASRGSRPDPRTPPRAAPNTHPVAIERHDRLEGSGPALLPLVRSGRPPRLV
jgi:hypothetical protein